MTGKWDSAITEIIKVARDERVLAMEIGGHVSWAMDARTLLGVSAGIVVDTVTESLRQVCALKILNTVRPI